MTTSAGAPSRSTQEQPKVVGYLPDDVPPLWRMIILGFQHVITMFPAPVLVALLVGFDVASVLFASGLATVTALALSKRSIYLTPASWPSAPSSPSSPSAGRSSAVETSPSSSQAFFRTVCRASPPAQCVASCSTRSFSSSPARMQTEMSEPIPSRKPEKCFREGS
jgi:hypothetical protein